MYTFGSCLGKSTRCEEKENMCFVCVWERQSEWEKETDWERETVWEREGECVCLKMLEWERESVCERERKKKEREICVISFIVHLLMTLVLQLKCSTHYFKVRKKSIMKIVYSDVIAT